MEKKRTFWICPRGCISVTDWDYNKNPPVATCRACGTKSTDGLTYKKKFFGQPSKYDKDESELENQQKSESSIKQDIANGRIKPSDPALNFSPRPMNSPKTTY
jgi:hypothetical protein